MGKKDVCPDLPVLDNALTLTTFGLLATLVFLLTHNAQYNTLVEFLVALVGSAVFIRVCKSVFRYQLFPYIGSKEAQLKTRNARKFGDQSWQFMVHFWITVYECHLLASYSEWSLSRTLSPPYQLLA